MSAPIVLDSAMFLAAVEAAAERAAVIEYTRQFTLALGHGGIVVDGPDRLVVIELWKPPSIPPVFGREVVWG